MMAALSSSSSFNPLFDHNTLLLHFSFSVFHSPSSSSSSSSSASSSLFCQPLRVVQHLGFIRCCTRKATLLKHGSRDALLQRIRLHSYESSSSSSSSSKGEKPTDVGSSDGHSQEDPVDTLSSKSIAIESPSQVKQEEGDAEVKHQLLFSGDAAMKGTMVAGLLLVGVVGGFGALGYLYKEQINEFLIQFSDVIEGFGPAGYALFIAVYAGLEILALPAIPLTMSAGLLFGTVIGTIIVSISGTIAATIAFLIARYLARDRILKLAERNKKFLAIDKAIGEDGFRVVTLLRLSPLLPFSLGNYLYGLTSVKLIPYILGSWLGMLPGSWAYVSAGALGRAFIQQEAETLGGGSEQLWTLGVGIIVTTFAAFYVTRLAKDAVKDLE